MGYKKCGCGLSKIAYILVFIGAINWGLVGLGMLLGGSGWNVVKMILGGWPMIEGIVYLLVGVAGVMTLMGCKCKACKACQAGDMPMKAPGTM